MCAIVTAPARTHHGKLNAAGIRVDPNLTEANMRGLQHPVKKRQAAAGIHNPLSTTVWLQR